MKVSDFFSSQTPMWRGLEVGTTLIVVNVLVVLTSLPLVTVGASVAAGYAVVHADPADYRGAAGRYFRAFARCWRQATVAHLGFTVALAALGGLVYLARESFLQFAPLLAMAILLLAALVFYPLLAVADQGLRQNLVGSFYIVLRRTAKVALAGVVWAVSAAFPVLVPKLLFVWMFLGIGLPLYLSYRLIGGIFHSLNLLDKEDADAGGDGHDEWPEASVRG